MRSVCTACGALELTTGTVAASPAFAINVNHSNNCNSCMLAGVYKNIRLSARSSSTVWVRTGAVRH